MNDQNSCFLEATTLVVFVQPIDVVRFCCSTLTSELVCEKARSSALENMTERGGTGAAEAALKKKRDQHQSNLSLIA